MSNKLSPNSKDIFFANRLDEVPQGASCRIVRLDCSQPSAQNRLAEMGLTEGVEVTLLRLAPLGDPMEISVRGYRLCLRRDTAHQILVGKACNVFKPTYK